MKITVQDLQRRYASLTDEQLLALDRADLTEVAQPCYDAELKRRGLLEPPPPAPPLSVATFRDAASAGRAQAILDEAGISSQLQDDPAKAGWLRLMVPAKRVNEARGLLEEDEDEGPRPQPWAGTISHRFVETNGIRMHIADAGKGPLVILCHGFPECWHSWRHQLPALASEGYRVVAPDLRGFGQTDRPAPLDAYDIFQLTGDLVGLVKTLGQKPALLVGHDWGAMIAWHAALFRPDLFRALALLSVPYVPRRRVNQSQWEAEKYPGKIFYQAALRSLRAELFFESDIRTRLLRGLWLLSGDAPADQRWQPAVEPGVPPSNWLPPRLMRWLQEADLEFLVGEYQRTGFTGGLNYYRNADRNWELTPFLDGAQLLQPTLFLAGQKDPVLDFLGEEFGALENNVPNLWRKVLIPRAGHWIQQEDPEEVNRWLSQFLAELQIPPLAAAAAG